jgi:hypothetical protein
MVPASGGATSTPTLLFIQPSSKGTTVDLFASQQEPTVVSFAHYGANYLAEESRNVTSAWGGGVEAVIGASKDINNSPLDKFGIQYLYWDIDLSTGAVRRGWTDKALIVSATEPVNAPNDQHWFDLSKNVMKVRRVTGATAHWLDKIRVFAGTYTAQGAIVPFVPTIIGSQVGISKGEYSAGAILLGTNNKPLRQSDGTFATTETDLIVQQTSGQNVKFDSAVVFAQASEEIPKFYLVSFSPDRRIKLGTHLNKNQFIAGIVVDDLNENETGQVITNGAIRNEQWNWPESSFGKPLFCSASGHLTLTPPQVGVSQQVGFVYDKDAIYLNLFPPVRL